MLCSSLSSWPRPSSSRHSGRVTESTAQFVAAVEKLQPGNKMLLVFDYSIGGVDVDPQAQVVLAHALSKGVKGSRGGIHRHRTHRPESQSTSGKQQAKCTVKISSSWASPPAPRPISAFAQDIAQVFPTDIRGKPLSSYPIMQGVKTAADFDIIAEFATGIPGPAEWVRQVVTRYNVPLACGVVAVMGPQNIPYLQSGQLVGLLGGGLKSAAEYEIAVKMPGAATAAMDAQSLGHVVIVLFVLIGNLLFYVERREQKAKKG